MATVPPAYSSREQQRQAKEYWRAQRQAARMQQSYRRGMRRSSMTGPIVLIAIGVIALLIETGRIQGEAFWLWYRQWWPLVLIGIGVVALLEWLIDRNSATPVRRSLGGLVFLVVVVSIVGFCASASRFNTFGNGSSHDSFGFFSDNENPFSFVGREYDNDVDTSQTVPAGSSIGVQNPHGDVTITASTDDQIHVHAHQVVRSMYQDDANRTFHQLDPKLTVSGTSVLVRVDGGGDGRADLTIEVPKTATTDITADHGDVTLEGLTGAANVTAKHGDVKFDGMAGNVTAHIGEGRYSHRGDFSAHGIEGDVTLDGGLNDVTISEVRGKVLLTGEYFGDTHLERLAQGGHFHSSRTDMEVGAINGDMTMDSDDLHLAQVAGPLRIVTRSKNIDASQVAGDVHIDSTNGDVNLAAVSPLGNIQIINKNRPITLSMPPGANFDINGSANGGELSNDFNLGVTGSDNNHAVSGQVGKGGVKVQLDADHGDITIRKGEDAMQMVEPLPPLPPVAPQPAPGAKVPHIKTVKPVPAPPVAQE
ncbi:MAG TPA: DUF4097 family beta strand repeat-containing protein [Acidisarcina sp.]